MSSRQDKEALLRFLSRFPEIDPEAIGFAMRIHELVRQADLDFDKYLEKDGLSASRFRVLEVLFLQEGHTLTPAELADRVTVLYEGQTVMQGPTREIFADRQRLAAYGLDLPAAVLKM